MQLNNSGKNENNFKWLLESFEKNNFQEDIDLSHNEIGISDLNTQNLTKLIKNNNLIFSANFSWILKEIIP